MCDRHDPRILNIARKSASVNLVFYDMTSIMNEEKLQTIEITIAHHEQQLQELNDVITDQWKQMDVLNRRLDKALSKIERMESGGEDGDSALSSIERAAQEKPPHY